MRKLVTAAMRDKGSYEGKGNADCSTLPALKRTLFINESAGQDRDFIFKTSFLFPLPASVFHFAGRCPLRLASDYVPLSVMRWMTSLSGFAARNAHAGGSFTSVPYSSGVDRLVLDGHGTASLERLVWTQCSI